MLKRRRRRRKEEKDIQVEGMGCDVIVITVKWLCTNDSVHQLVTAGKKLANRNVYCDVIQLNVVHNS